MKRAIVKQMVSRTLNGLFDSDIGERRVNRMLDRAVQARVDATAETRNSMGRALAVALSVHKGPVPDRRTLRQKAPDTGGRTFHLDHKTISKRKVVVPGKLPVHTAAGKPGAHQTYIERDEAVERRGGKLGRPDDVGLEPMNTKASEYEKAPAASVQAYIENPEKLGEEVASFGNIAKTPEERLEFWLLLEEHERMPNARVQNRLIVELPKESTPEARSLIMGRFGDFFQARGLPYHIAIHAPTAKNDPRNVHAHFVYAERPAKRIPHPITGALCWDFTITETYVKTNRVRKTTHPYRQNKLPELRARGFVYKLREQFAAIVTDVMATIDSEVAFDPRSHKKMGINVTPLGTIKRSIYEQMRKGKLALYDAEWTKRVVVAEIAAASQREDPEMVKLARSTTALTNLKAAWPNLSAINSRLDRGSRLISTGTFTRRAFCGLINGRIQLESERATTRVMRRAEAAACRRVVEACKEPSTDYVYRSEPEPATEAQDLVLIGAVAALELEKVEAELRAAEILAKQRLRLNQDAWSKMAGPKLCDLAIQINTDIAAMYDTKLQGTAFAESLRPILDELYPERKGTHFRSQEAESLLSENDTYAVDEAFSLTSGHALNEAALFMDARGYETKNGGTDTDMLRNAEAVDEAALLIASRVQDRDHVRAYASTDSAKPDLGNASPSTNDTKLAASSFDIGNTTEDLKVKSDTGNARKNNKNVGLENVGGGATMIPATEASHNEAILPQTPGGTTSSAGMVAPPLAPAAGRSLISPRDPQAIDLDGLLAWLPEPVRPQPAFRLRDRRRKPSLPTSPVPGNAEDLAAPSDPAWLDVPVDAANVVAGIKTPGVSPGPLSQANAQSLSPVEVKSSAEVIPAFTVHILEEGEIVDRLGMGVGRSAQIALSETYIAERNAGSMLHSPPFADAPSADAGAMGAHDVCIPVPAGAASGEEPNQSLSHIRSDHASSVVPDLVEKEGAPADDKRAKRRKAILSKPGGRGGR